MKNKKVLFIGDSHASFFSGYNSIQKEYPEETYNRFTNFEGIRLGPVLAYSLHKSNTSNNGREKIFEILDEHSPDKYMIGLCFGEIDCRCQIIKHADKEKIPITDAAYKCFQYYEIVIDEIVNKGFEVILWNVIPTSPGTHNNDAFPHYGSDEQRTDITVFFNSLLKKKADNKKIYFLDIYNKLLNKGKRIDYYFFDGVHLSQIAMFITGVQLNKIVKVFSNIDMLKLKMASEKHKFLYRYMKLKHRIWKIIH